jgi:hypothetical protein
MLDFKTTVCLWARDKYAEDEEISWKESYKMICKLQPRQISIRVFEVNNDKLFVLVCREY